MKLIISKTKNAASLYVAKSVWKNNRCSSVIVEKLGTEKKLREKLNGQDPYKWAKAYVKELTIKEKEAKRQVMVEYFPTKVIEKDRQVSFNGGYLFLQKIYYDLGINKICESIKKRHKFKFDLNETLEYLTYGRMLFPASKLATQEIAKTFIKPANIEMQHFYRSLEVLSKEHDFIQAELYKNSQALLKRNTKILFYDCTNFYFEIEEGDEDKQYGKSKENRPNPIVEMGLFMDGDGIPLAFGIYPGNTNEQTTLNPLEEKILSDFKLSKFVVCTDAGLSSTANRKFNSVKNRAFITTQSIKKLKRYLMDWALDSKGWRLSGVSSKDGKQEREYDLSKIEEFYQDTNRTVQEKMALESKVFYKERWINENGLEQRLIVTFSLKYKNYQRGIREGQIERAQKAVNTNSAKLKKCNANDYKRFVKKEYCTKNGEMAEKEILSIDQEIIEDESRFDGFYGVCTNLEDRVDEIVKINQGRWEIEECFRIIKSEFKARPVYLRRKDRIRAHFMSCFLSLIIYRMLEKQIMPTKDMDGKFSCHQILSTLSDMNFYNIRHEGFVPTYKRTDLTDTLHERFGFRTDYEILSNKKIRDILKITKPD